MKTMKAKDFKPSDDMIASAHAVFSAMAYAEVMRKEVDMIYKHILADTPIYETRVFGKRHEPSGARIYNHDDMYLSDDEETCTRIYAESNRIERERGLKPADMIDDKCPALVAEHLLMNAQHLLIEVMEPLTKITLDMLLCSKNGLENLKKYLDLTLRLLAPFVKA